MPYYDRDSCRGHFLIGGELFQLGKDFDMGTMSTNSKLACNTMRLFFDVR